MSDKNEGIYIIAGEADDGMTARGLLRRTQGVSQRLIRRIANGEGDGAGALFINGRPARFRDRVGAGDEIHLVFPKEESHIEPQDIPLSVLYEDEDILVINKPPGIVVHPTKGHRDGTLANAIVFHMRSRGENYRPRFVSRLDMGTSGVLVVGKNSHAQDSLAKQGAAGSVEKIYTAVLTGRLEDDLPRSGIIDLPIGLAAPDEPRRAVIPETEGGYPSQTAYEIIGTIGTSGASSTSGTSGDLPSEGGGGEDSSAVGGEGGLTVVRARLITGRTHQIRVHFAHYGHPVLGDTLYGSPSPLIARQALHADEISFAHPATGKHMRFKAPPPEDLASLPALAQPR